MADHGLNILLQRLERLLTAPVQSRGGYLGDDPARERREEIELLEEQIDFTIEHQRRSHEAIEEPGVVIHTGGSQW